MINTILYKEIMISIAVLGFSIFSFEFFKNLFSLKNNSDNTAARTVLNTFLGTINWFLIQIRNKNKITFMRFLISSLIIGVGIFSVLGSMYRDLIYEGNKFWFTLGCLMLAFITHTVFCLTFSARKNRDFLTLGTVLSFSIIFIQIVFHALVTNPSVLGSLLSFLISIFALCYLVKDQLLLNKNSVETIFTNVFLISMIFLMNLYFNPKELLFGFQKYQIEPILITNISLCIFAYMINKKVLTNAIIQTKYLGRLYIYTSNVIILIRVFIWKI